MKRSLIAMALLLSGVPALAHHSFDAEYDANKVTNISGFVTKVDWQNPHAFVYIDAAEDPTLTMADYDLPTVDRTLLPAFVGPSVPVTFPEAERRQMAERPLDPAIRRAIVDDNKVRPDYARIRVPVLAIYRTATLEQTLKERPPKNEQERTALIQAYPGFRAILSKWQRDLLAGVPTARIVELPGANLYMFLSNEADVLREVRAFAATLNQ